MTCTYSELYVPLAQRVLGDAFDYAVNSLHFSLKNFIDLFVASGMAHQFEIGNPTYIAGKNGCEIAKLVIQKCGLNEPQAEDAMYLDKSVEYWIGWSLAYYQWQSHLHYYDICQEVSVEDFYSMYKTFHEADISLFVESMDQRMIKRQTRSSLRRLRTYASLSQSQLSLKSNVPLRQIQLFEQGQRDIHKTQGDTLEKLAHALHCQIEDLL